MVICRISVSTRPLAPKILLIVISGKSNPAPEIISSGKATYMASTYVTFCSGLNFRFSVTGKGCFSPLNIP